MVSKVSGTRRGQTLPLVVLVAAGLVAAAPARAQTAEQDFLRVMPLPDGIDEVEPILGAVNVLFKDCGDHWPEGYRAWRVESVAAEGQARKRDIYSWLRARQAFKMRECGCVGKVAEWEPVETIYASLQTTHGEVLIRHTADFAA